MKHGLDFSSTPDATTPIRQRIALDARSAQLQQQAQQYFLQPGFGPTVRHPVQGLTAPPDHRARAGTEPVLKEREADYPQLRFPTEVWRLILKNLDEASLLCSMRTCRGLYHLGWGLELNRVDPFSGSGRLQQKISSDKLNAIIREYFDFEDDLESDAGKKETGRLAEAFERELHSFATRFRCIQVSVITDFVEATIKALTVAPRWQSLALSFRNSNTSDARMIARFEQALATNGRRADILLDLSKVPMREEDWKEVLPSGSALRLTSLRVARDHLTHPGLLELMKSDNALEHLAVVHGPAPLLQAMQTGSRRLTRLIISNAAQILDFPLLLTALRSKDRLRCLHYCFGQLGEDSVTIANLLSAATHLEELYLSGCTIEVDASQGSHAALRNSKLRVIGLTDCSLKGDGTKPNSKVHAELLIGLREAPGLETLDLSSSSNDFPQDAAFFALAFAGNRSARFLRADPEHFSKWEMCVSVLNALRGEKGWSPISLQKPMPSMEDNWWED